tara:strand:+ start:185 stop:727 length:543 start_codon:yes stop_codon:yes gene_type:complete
VKKIALISTGGTIEKTYDEMRGVMHNETRVLDVMLAQLQLEGVEMTRVPLMNKDSLEMDEADHTLIARTVGAMAEAHDGVIVVHGTDRLAETGEKIVEVLGTGDRLAGTTGRIGPRVPVVLTGAMRPYLLRSTDALQNLTEALLAVQLLSPGVYVAMHNKVLAFPGVTKDRNRGTFVKEE